MIEITIAVLLIIVASILGTLGALDLMGKAKF